MAGTGKPAGKSKIIRKRGDDREGMKVTPTYKMIGVNVTLSRCVSIMITTSCVGVGEFFSKSKLPP